MDDINGRRKLYQNLKDDADKWFKVLSKIYDFISRLYIKIICTVIVKEDFKNAGKVDVEKWAFELLVEKINRYIEFDSTHQDDRGLLVMDSVDIKADVENESK